MELQTRYRIAGGVFFLSLVVIFVPMLFDEKSSSKVTIEGIPSFEPTEFATLIEPDVSNVLEKREVLRSMVDEDGFRRDTNTKVGEPALLYDTSEATVWAVQLGSFDSDEKANVLRAQLRDEGHVTWVSHAKVNGSVWTRVAAGPFHSLLDAEAYRDKAIRTFEVDALVVRFLP